MPTHPKKLTQPAHTAPPTATTYLHSQPVVVFEHDPIADLPPHSVLAVEGSPQDHGENDACTSKKPIPKKNLSKVKKSINADSKPKFKKGKPTKSLEKFSQVVKPTTKKQSLMLDYLTGASLSANEDQALDAISPPHVSED